MADNILEIRHLSKSFGTHEVLRDIDFDVKKGDVISIIGASGSGKSTLLRCVNLLETPTSGDILYHGENVTGKSVNAAKYRSHVGMVFQSFNLFNNMTVLKNCMVGQMKVLGRSKAEAQEQAIRVLPVLLFVNAMRNQLSIPPTFINAEQLINLFGLRDTARQFGRPQSVFDSSFNPLTFSTTVKYLAFFAGQEWLRHMRFLEWDPKQAEQDAKDEDERKSREALAKKYNLTSDGDNAASDADLDSSADSNLSEDSDSSEEAGSEPTEE